MKNIKNYNQETLDLGYFPNSHIDFNYNYINSKKDELEINYNTKGVEDYSVLHISDFKDSKETNCTLSTINKILKRALAFYLNGQSTFKETYNILCFTTEVIDLFDMETYNGWDIDAYRDYLPSKKAALISTLTYCITKIHLTIKLNLK